MYCSVEAKQYHHKRITEQDIRSAYLRYGSTELKFSNNSARPEPTRTERFFCSVEAKQYPTNEEQSGTSVPLTGDTAVQNQSIRTIRTIIDARIDPTLKHKEAESRLTPKTDTNRNRTTMGRQIQRLNANKI